MREITEQFKRQSSSDYERDQKGGQEKIIEIKGRERNNREE